MHEFEHTEDDDDNDDDEKKVRVRIECNIYARRHFVFGFECSHITNATRHE